MSKTAHKAWQGVGGHSSCFTNDTKCIFLKCFGVLGINIEKETSLNLSSHMTENRTKYKKMVER